MLEQTGKEDEKTEEPPTESVKNEPSEPPKPAEEKAPEEPVLF